ncbi:MAG: sensor histidine kinase, partial [Verrucomicrobiales bacterium]
KIGWYSLALLGVALVGMELAFLAIGKAILNPIQRLAETANEISGGDLSRRVEVHSSDEVGELGRDFNQMTERLIEANTGLERKVEERTAELEQSNADLAQFAYVASHDLKEPLRMVTSYVQLLERRLGDDLDVESKEFMGFAVDGAMRMRGLIDDLLAYSRVGTKRKAFEAVSAKKVVDASLMNLKVAIDESGAEVNVGEMPELMADPTQLTQLFQNLVANAIKFRGDRKPVVSIKADREGDHWNFEVSDNGIGIDKEFCDQIFLIFQRLHNRSEYEGTGIGLAVCKKIVERHGGKIGVRSELGDGSTFFFSLQATPIPAGEEPA